MKNIFLSLGLVLSISGGVFAADDSDHGIVERAYSFAESGFMSGRVSRDAVNAFVHKLDRMLSYETLRACINHYFVNLGHVERREVKEADMISLIANLAVSGNLSPASLAINIDTYRRSMPSVASPSAPRNAGVSSFPGSTKMICSEGHSDICLGCYKGAVRAGRSLKCEAGGCGSTKIYRKADFVRKFPEHAIYGNDGDCRLCMEELSRTGS